MDSENAFKTSCLLNEYRLLEPRLAALVVGWRVLARHAQLDQPELGTLPPHAFSLMVLYYLQQQKVVWFLFCFFFFVFTPPKKNKSGFASLSNRQL